MITNPEIDRVISQISSLYENPQEALALLKDQLPKYMEKKNISSSDGILKEIRNLRASEITMYEKRTRNKIPRKTSLLKLALDSTPIKPKQSHSLGAPAYQAETHYTGKGRL